MATEVSASGRPVRAAAARGDNKQREVAAALAGTQTSAFLANTYEMLEDARNAQYIHWNAAGTSLIVEKVFQCLIS